MISLHLKLRKINDDILILSLPIWFRVMFLLICGSFIIGMIAAQTVSLLVVIIIIVSALLAMYNETWIFNTKDQIIESRFGTIPFFKTDRIPITDILNIELRSFTKGSLKEDTKEQPKFFQTKYATLSLIDNAEERHVIEMRNYRQKEELQKNGTVIASFIGKELKGETNSSE
ncbi:MAG: hypothetical protein ACLFR1_05880 [Spirochaetia bacterium]